MLAVFMIARLIRSVSKPPEETKKEGHISVPNLVDFLAMAAIAYLAYDIYTLGAKTVTEMNKINSSFPMSAP